MSEGANRVASGPRAFQHTRSPCCNETPPVELLRHEELALPVNRNRRLGGGRKIMLGKAIAASEQGRLFGDEG